MFTPKVTVLVTPEVVSAKVCTPFITKMVVFVSINGLTNHDGTSLAEYVEEAISSLLEVTYTTTEIEKVNYSSHSKYMPAIPKTLKVELAEELVFLEERVEPVELVVTEEVTTKTNQTVLAVLLVPEVTQVLAVVITVTVLVLEVLEVLAYKVVQAVLAETAVASVQPVEAVQQEILVLVEQQVTQVLTETAVAVTVVPVVHQVLVVLAVQPVVQQDITYKTVII